MVVSTVVVLTLPPSVASPADSVGSATAPAQAAGAEPRTVHVLRTAVTSRRAGTVHLVVRVYRKQRVVRTVRRPVQVAGGERTTPVRVKLQTARRSPAMTVRLAAPGQRAEGFRLHRIRWTHRTTGGRLTNGCRYSRRGIPTCGAYLGQTYGANADPSPFEQRYGRRLGIRRSYFRADQLSWALATARDDVANGRLPWVSFKLPASWEEVADGDADAWAVRVAKQFGRLDGPVWLAFHHEPEYDGDIADWTAMQEHLGPIVRSQENLAFTVIVTGYHQFFGEEQFRLGNMWPQGMKVDVAGFDIYNQLGVVKDGEENTKGTDLNAWYFSKIKPWAEREGVAWGLAETGFTHKAADLDPHWIRRTHRQLENAGGVAFAYFNTTLNSIAPWHLSTPEKRAGWREAQDSGPLLPR